jgi:Na+/melibiose symporter-like transporter
LAKRALVCLAWSRVMTLIFNSVRDGVAMYYFKYYIVDDTAVAISKMTFTFSTLYFLVGQAFNMVWGHHGKTCFSIAWETKTLCWL